MFIELIFFLVFGTLIGIVFGILPGIHPNNIILLIPVFIMLDISTSYLLGLIVGMAVTNSFIDFIPTILFGIPDAGNELSMLPGHKLLLSGNGYAAIKLTVIGSLGAVIICVIILPIIILTIPPLYTAIKQYIYVFLIAIVVFMILSENKHKKIIALFSFLLAGIIGLIAFRLPISGGVVLLPIFSGFFGASMLILQLKKKTKIPSQSSGDIFISKNDTNRSVISGTFGGIISGFLPGVGSSQIATLFSKRKKPESFLISIGAVTTANIILSIMSLWLIGKARSGVAIVVNSLVNIGFMEFLIIIFSAVFVSGCAAILTLLIAKRMIKIIEKVDYSQTSFCVLIFMSFIIILFSGIYGIILFITCTSLGIFINLAGVHRGNLMGVLILPTILFYIGV